MGVDFFCKMYLVTLVICCCSGDSGFDGTVMGGINSMVQYQKYFGLNGVGSKTRYGPLPFCISPAEYN